MSRATMLRRSVLAVVLLGAGCGGDPPAPLDGGRAVDAGGSDGGGATDAGEPGGSDAGGDPTDAGLPTDDAGADDPDAGADDPDAGPPARDAGPPARDAGPPAASPVIRRVSWVHATPCAADSRAVTVTVEADDADTPASELSYFGMIGGCSGAIDAPTSALDCSGAGETVGAATVSDEAGRADTVTFTVGVCTDGSESF